MGISSAMSTKDRKDILSGLIGQGATVHREGKRGTILNLPNGNRFSVPGGTSDAKSRLAMRAQIRREGLHWSLDPPESPRKKETTMSTETIERPATREHQRVPAAVTKYKRTTAGLPREITYRQNESLLHEFAEKTPFWTDAYSQEAQRREIPGYRSLSAMNNAAQIILDFAGFVVIESKVNRGGYSYRWDRDPATPWPTEFAKETLVPGYKGKPGPRSDSLDDTPPKYNADRTVPLVELESQEEGDARTADLLESQAAIETEASQEDETLDLAVEQEQRAIRAERKAEAIQVVLDAERRAHAETRRSLMVRIGGWENKLSTANAEIARLRSLLEEERLVKRENGEDTGGLLRRAHEAEQKIDELTRDRDRLAENLSDAIRTIHEAAPAVPQPADEEQWWPLEGGDQSVTELTRGAEAFGLEVRVQARRRA